MGPGEVCAFHPVPLAATSRRAGYNHSQYAAGGASTLRTVRDPRPLDAGGMGEVYKARDTRLDGTVAVKVSPPLIASREDRRARFEPEARRLHSHACIMELRERPWR